MANIAIRDLTESIDLDHEAMTAVAGGSRYRRQPAIPAPACAGAGAGASRLVDFPWNAQGLKPAASPSGKKPSR
ncbi:MAG TPA: hypothetical protein VIM12_17705 [Noviherbaspirillum sp.]|jgi:hypothetical protein|uniref:hypothetical protein n=1 Tax=Noviherbaspirillum sp. TaxID=1926288 RepID=UPI002F93E632